MSQFFDPNQGFTADRDFAAESEAQARRRKLLEAMQAQSMQTPIVGDTGLGQMLAKLATAYVQKKTGETQEVESKTLAQARQADLAQNLGAYMDMRQGRPGQVLDDQQAAALMEHDQMPAGGLAEPVKADPRQAILRAMASQHPELQAVGKAELTNMGKAKEATPMFAPDGTLIRVGSAGSPEVLGKYAKPEKPGDQYSEPYMVQGSSGPILVQKNLTTNRREVVDKAPKTTITQTLDTGSKGATKAAEALGGKVPEVLSGAVETVSKAQAGIQNAQRMMELASSPEVLAGFASAPALFLGNLSAKLGLTGPNAAAQTQALLSSMASETLNNVKKLPGPLSEKELPFLERASTGQLEFTPEVLQHLAGISIAANNNALLDAMKQYSGTLAVPGAEVGAQMYPMPRIQYSLDPELFGEQGQTGRVHYNRALPGLPGAAGQGPGSGSGTPAAVPSGRKPSVSNW